jgi:hypothetical protein
MVRRRPSVWSLSRISAKIFRRGRADVLEGKNVE